MTQWFGVKEKEHHFQILSVIDIEFPCANFQADLKFPTLLL